MVTSWGTGLVKLHTSVNSIFQTILATISPNVAVCRETVEVPVVFHTRVLQSVCLKHDMTEWSYTPIVTSFPTLYCAILLSLNFELNCCRVRK